MDGDIAGLFVYAGVVLVMVFYWTYYIRYARRNPRSEKWYDELAWEGAVSDGVLFFYPYSTLVLGEGGIAGLAESVNSPDSIGTVLKVEGMVALAIGGIGFSGGFGVPLPWPFVPRWVVDIRTAKRARRRERRQARKRERKNRPDTLSRAEIEARTPESRSALYDPESGHRHPWRPCLSHQSGSRF
ncbi:hypothetical protein ACUW9K_000700 [Corynebacterium hesseae]